MGKITLVTGSQRTGTSLMMELLSYCEYEKITDNNVENTEYLKNVQPFYNEHIKFSSGLTDENIEEFLELTKDEDKNYCVKILIPGLVKMDRKFFDYFDRIIIMIRDWRQQELSWLPIQRENFRQSLIKQKYKGDIEDTMTYYGYPFGTQYANNYTKLISKMILDNFIGKCYVIDFDQLIRKNVSHKILPHIHDEIIDLKYVKHRHPINTFECNAGLYEYLDLLNAKLLGGAFDNHFIKTANNWGEIVTNRLKECNKKLIERLEKNIKVVI